MRQTRNNYKSSPIRVINQEEPFIISEEYLQEDPEIKLRKLTNIIGDLVDNSKILKLKVEQNQERLHQLKMNQPVNQEEQL